MANLFPNVIVTVAADGTTTTDFLHFVGANCLAASQQVHSLLAEYGIETEIVGKTPKPELLAAAGQPGQEAMIDLSQTEGGA